MEEVESIHVGTWAVITINAARLVARIHSLDFVKVEKAKELPVEEVLKAVDIGLSPLFDYFTPIRPMPLTDETGRPKVENGGPVMGWGREYILHTRDGHYNTSVMNFKNGPGIQWDFFSQLSPDDRDTMKRRIDEACENAPKKEEAKKIEVPSPGQVAALARAHGHHGTHGRG